MIVKFVEAAYSWAPSMVDRMIKRFGDRGKRFGELFTQNIGGEKCVDEEYRLRAHRRFRAAARRLGLTYSVCYEYRYEKGSNGNIVDKTGISIGPEVTTSDQCHGRRVPIHVRNSSDEPFQPLSCCPAEGCLYCVEDGEKPPCGDVLMGEAPALRTKDLRRPIG